jgi:hypothetical protein
MPRQYYGWVTTYDEFATLAPTLTDQEREELRQRFVEWVQQDNNCLHPNDGYVQPVDQKVLKKVRKRLAKDLRKGRVFPSCLFICEVVNPPRGGAQHIFSAVNLDLTRDQVLFWVALDPTYDSMLVKLARFRNPEDHQRVVRAADQLDIGDLTFFAKLDPDLRSSFSFLVRAYRERVQGARYIEDAQQKIMELTASQLRFWFPPGHIHVARVFRNQVKTRLMVLEHGASSATDALRTINDLTADHLAYWAAETGIAVFEISLLVKTGAAPDEKQATEQVYFDRMYRAGPGAEERIVDRPAREVWKEALTPTQMDLGQWSTWGGDVLRLVCQHYPVEDNHFFPIVYLLNMAGDLDKHHEPAIFHAFQTLVSLCNEEPMTDFIGAVAAQRPAKWMSALLEWDAPVLPGYSL